jgi:hypothetical protein
MLHLQLVRVREVRMTAPLAGAAQMLREPIPVRVIRYGCPSCGRRASSKSRAREHMARCWLDPANRGCKTCANFNPAEDACGCEPGCNWGNSGESVREHCGKGVDLSGDPAEVKPGPIVHCPEWELRSERDI